MAVSELHCNIALSVALYKFYNIDLYQRGFYQVRCGLKTAKKMPIRVETNVLHTKASHLFPANLVDGQAVGQTFEIMYQDEEVDLKDVIEFKVTAPIAADRIPKIVSIPMCVELYFIEQDKLIKKGGSEIHAGFTCVSRRMVYIQFPLCAGLHAYRPLVFEYITLAGVTMTVHGSIISLSLEQKPKSPSVPRKTPHGSRSNLQAPSPSHQTTDRSSPELQSNLNSDTGSVSSASLVPVPPGSYMAPLENLVFAGKSTQDAKWRQAYDFHSSCCRLLLTAYEALQLKIFRFCDLLPSKYQIRIRYVDCERKLEIMETNVKVFAERQVSDEELLGAIETDLQLLSGELSGLWYHFLELFRDREEITTHLANEHHHQRMKRFSEGFFTTETSAQDLSSYSGLGQYHDLQARIAEQMRRSEYFAYLPDLPLFCHELDGTRETTPVIFEEKFLPVPSREGIRLSAPGKSTLLNIGPELAAPSKLPPLASALPRSTFFVPGELPLPDPSISNPNQTCPSTLVDDTNLASDNNFKSANFASGLLENLEEVPVVSNESDSVPHLGSDSVRSSEKGKVESSTFQIAIAIDKAKQCASSTSHFMKHDKKRHSTGTVGRQRKAMFGRAAAAKLLQKLKKRRLSSLSNQLSTDSEPCCSDPVHVNGLILDDIQLDLEHRFTTLSEAVETSARARYNVYGPCDLTDCNLKRYSDRVQFGSAPNLLSDSHLHDGGPMLDETLRDGSGGAGNPALLPLVGSCRNYTDPNGSLVQSKRLSGERLMSTERADSEPCLIDEDPIKRPLTSPDGIAAHQACATSTVDQDLSQQLSQSDLNEEDVSKVATVGSSSCNSSPNEVDSSDDYGTCSTSSSQLITPAKFQEGSENSPSSPPGHGSDTIDVKFSLNSNHSHSSRRMTAGLGADRSITTGSCSNEDSLPKLSRGVDSDLLKFVECREEFKRWLLRSSSSTILRSQLSTQASYVPYFSQWNDGSYTADPKNLHLIVCVHGLEGSSIDLRMIRAYLELGLPDENLDFLMSESNQDDTFTDFEAMTKKLVDEILLYLSRCVVHPKRISFIGHSLGTILVRSALTDPRLAPWLEILHTFLSLNGPHCGIVYNASGLISMGIWLMQRWKKSASLLQLSMKDSADFRQTFLYELSRKKGLEHFRYILLVGSYQDHYVPMHSAHIQLCKPALKDTSVLGHAYTEMVMNLLHPIITRGHTTVVRYSAFHALPTASTNNLIGRAAHVAVLDSDLFIEKLLAVSGLAYFRISD